VPLAFDFFNNPRFFFLSPARGIEQTRKETPPGRLRLIEVNFTPFFDPPPPQRKQKYR
jgi:hypothetical protein